MSANTSKLRTRFLQSRFAPILTHGALLLLSVSLWMLLWFVPFWLMLVPGVLLAHRIGILLHEYLHGIPFRSYRNNLAVYGFFDGAMLMFGLMELFRGTHLTHHRWLNAEGDNAARMEESRPGNGWLSLFTSNEVTVHLLYLWEALHGRQPVVRVSRVLFGAVFSTICVVGWLLLDRGDIAWKLIAVNIVTVFVPASLRAAIEHHGPAGTQGFANEYRAWIPLFNLNRHIHHHENMHCPWYLLQYRTNAPLPPLSALIYWYRVHVSGEYVLMQPMPAPDQTQSGTEQHQKDPAPFVREQQHPFEFESP